MNKISLSNFKGYTSPTSVEFSDITINVGMNSVGKSTLVQSILLVRQAFDEMKKYHGTTKKEFRISLNGPYDLQLGDSNQITLDSTAEILVEVDDIPFAFAKDSETVIDAEFKAQPQDKEGTLIRYEEDIEPETKQESGGPDLNED